MPAAGAELAADFHHLNTHTTWGIEVEFTFRRRKGNMARGRRASHVVAGKGGSWPHKGRYIERISKQKRGGSVLLPQHDIAGNVHRQ